MNTLSHRFLSFLAVLGLMPVSDASAQVLTQTFHLQPGWNSVWIEVDPPNRDPEVVFAGLPLVSVWTWSDRVSATDFIQNPGDAGWNRAQWLSYFPPSGPEAQLSNLRAVLPQRAYLVKLGGDNAVTWSITGLPTLRNPEWSPDRYNLRGFPIDPAFSPTFRTFFRSSPAHYDATRQQLTAIHRLSPDGQWHAVSPEDTMVRGEAYWVFTQGRSDYVAPFHCEVSTGNLMNYDAVISRISLTLHNRHALSKSIRITSATETHSPLLLLPRIQLGQTNPPPALTNRLQIVPASASHRLVVGIDRSQLLINARSASAPGRHTNLLSVSDGEGTLFYVGLSAMSQSAQDFTGLWLGTASITNVVPTPEAGDTNFVGTVAMAFPLRLLLHVDSGGVVSLLRDVTLLYAVTNSSTVIGTNGTTSFDTVLASRPSRLITDPSILAALPPADLRSGRISGRRLTAPHFDFALAPGQFQLPLTGVFALSNQLTAELSIPPDLPSNPFLHRYHPDHGTNQAYSITREITLLLEATDDTPTGEGDEALEGTYSEVITGLHKRPLSTSGSLSLRRLSEVGALNAP